MAAAAEYLAVPKAEPLKEECREFVAAIAEGRSPRTDGAEGLAVSDVLERAAAAIRAGA
jgi:predicted dehydrogenase